VYLALLKPGYDGADSTLHQPTNIPEQLDKEKVLILLYVTAADVNTNISKVKLSYRY
jgi:hypothetical protein